MAHGTPDWGVTAGAQTVFQLTDLGELAARLGSPITHDRRGDVIWWDDFEWSLNKWATDSIGTGGSVALSTERARNGTFSALLTGGSTSSRSASLQHRLPVRAVSACGFEYSYSYGSLAESFDIQVDWRDGSSATTFRVRYTPDTEELSYLDSSGGMTVFATGVKILDNATLFYTWKLVVDLTTKQYVRLVKDDAEYSLAGVDGREVAASQSPTLAAVIAVVSDVASNAKLYVDDVIITQNEPA